MGVRLGMKRGGRGERGVTGRETDSKRVRETIFLSTMPCVFEREEVSVCGGECCEWVRDEGWQGGKRERQSERESVRE